jgi:hypothetical protein
LRESKFYISSGLVKIVISAMKTPYRLALLGALSGFACMAASPSPLPSLAGRYGEAIARTKGDTLIVSTGRVERRWRWTGAGLVTAGLKDLAHDREWGNIKPGVRCDWAYQGVIEGTDAGKLLSLTSREDDDQGFTSRHLEVAAEVEYPSRHLTVR